MELDLEPSFLSGAFMVPTYAFWVLCILFFHRQIAFFKMDHSCIFSRIVAVATSNTFWNR